MRIKIWVGKRTDPERHQREYEVYKIGEKIPVDYIPYSEVKERIDEIWDGTYLETADGWVAPVVWSHRLGLTRIASDKFATFHKKRLDEQEIWYHPPKNWHRQHRIKNKRLTKMQKRFCWEYARLGDGTLAERAAGYKEWGVHKTLMKNEKVQSQIQSDFRKQIEMAGLKENELVAGRLPKMNELFDQMVAAIARRVQEGEASDKDVEILKSVLKENKQVMDFAADLLGYRGNTEEATLKIEAKKTFRHKLPEPIEEVDYEEVANGKDKNN